MPRSSKSNSVLAWSDCYPEMLSPYEGKPWLALYETGQPSSNNPEFASMLDVFADTLARHSDADAIRYFDGRLTFGDIDRLSDALTVGLLANGFARGDRCALYLQNTPQFVIAQIAVWKAGGIVVSINPMYKEREVRELLADSGATALISLESLYLDVLAHVLAEPAGLSVGTILTTSETLFQSKDDPRGLGEAVRRDCPGTTSLSDVFERYAGETPPQVELGAENVAFLTYTSGTTGPPKGAMTSHRNVVFNAQTYRDWASLSADDVILGVAPLFHITGLVAHIAVALLVGAPLVLTCRFDAELVLETIDSEQVTFTVGSITVFIALMNAPSAPSASLRSLRAVFSGGAPIPPSIVDAFEKRFGCYIHNIYGLTETTSPSHATPLGSRAPVDPGSGALSVGVPVYDTIVRVVDEDGQEVPPGQVGELVTEGPQVTSGYWDKPEETAAAIVNGRLHTGDVGYMDANGWFYVVDRMKDQINAGGYKVWPREVEDVLYEHPSVREAAVVGVADEYRGETVKAFVSLRPGTQVTEAELIEFSKSRLAAYKYPRSVEIVDEIPKTVTGKLLRRELRG